MNRSIFILLIVLFGITLKAQTNLDSLYSLWQDETQSDSIRVVAFKTYIWDGYVFSNPDSALVIIENLHRFAKKNNYSRAAAYGYSYQGVSNYLKGNYPRALDYHLKALKILEERDDKNGIASSQGNIGLIYEIQGNYPRALEYYEKALKLYEERDDKNGISIALINIGQNYWNQGNYPRALEYNERALKISEEIGIKLNIAHSLTNIGNIYYDQGNYPRALEHFEKSLKIFEESGNKQGVANDLGNIGFIYGRQKNYTDALDFCKRALEISEKFEILDGQKNACQCIYYTYKSMGKGNEALEYLEKLNVIDDSLNSEETSKKLQQMEFQKEMLADSIAKAEEARLVQEVHKEEVRQKNKTRNMLATGGLFAILLAVGFYSRWRYVRRSRDIISKEKDRSDNLLLNILPAEIAEELKEKGEASARDFDMVSILFTDFKGFTEASSKMSAGMLVAEINTCFEAFDGICEKYKVEKIKTIGDAYMAAGGLPIPTDDSVKNTVLAALEMQDFISKRKKESDADGKPAFEMRVGIHTGPVVAGIVGVKKFQYDIWGDTVNTASRMESSGEVGKVNISQATYELIKDDPEFTFEKRGKIQAKGKGEMEMHFVQRSRSR